MDHFDYRDGELWCEGVALSAIAKAVGTPVYVYSSATLERHFNVFQDAFKGLGVGFHNDFTQYRLLVGQDLNDFLEGEKS